ncbi:hypothetical protein CSC02_1232 [Enterobacter hormaechei subsp. hoffmannii]|nr:hypothetical protein CSC02_1232 [Enterobacter hormaechei subsp. hoffmannii]
MIYRQKTLFLILSVKNKRSGSLTEIFTLNSPSGPINRASEAVKT